jgi:uncharacterized coiled-coil protein SlyX
MNAEEYLPLVGNRITALQDWQDAFMEFSKLATPRIAELEAQSAIAGSRIEWLTERERVLLLELQAEKDGSDLRVASAEKRVAELEERIVWRTSMMEQWQAQSEAQQKRITELERDFDMLTDSLQLAEAECDRLESQLAWTPVSDGLPTDDGVYEFVDMVPGGRVRLFDLYVRRENTWKVTPSEHWDYTHFRRITLPEPTT